MYANWSNFAFYQTNDIVDYQTVEYQALQPNTNVVPTALGANWAVLSTPTPSAVNSLNTLDGNVTLISNDMTFTANPTTKELDIQLSNPAMPILGGVWTTFVVGLKVATIPIAGITSSSVVMAVFIHPTTGGASQYIESIVTSTNQAVVTCFQTIATTDSIIWVVVKY